MSEPEKMVSPGAKRTRRSRVDFYLPEEAIASIPPVPWAAERLMAEERKGHSLQFRARPTLRAKIDEAAASALRARIDQTKEQQK